MSKEKIIPYDSSESASIQTVTGWVSRGGRFWGDDEHMARYDGCTHMPCNTCGELMEVRSYCKPCYRNKETEKWQSMPRKDWDGIEPLYSQNTDVWFYSFDDLAEYCEENDCSPQSLYLIISEPVYADQIDPMDHYADDLPEGGDLPNEIEDAFEKLNAVIKDCAIPLSYLPGKFAPTDSSVELLRSPIAHGINGN